LTSTKSTVLGVRLDHERRAWIESAAAAQGLTVRGLVERMIDEARAAEAAGEEPLFALRKVTVRATAPGGSEAEAQSPMPPMANGSAFEPPRTESVPAREHRAPGPPMPGESPCAELAHLMSLSGQMVCGVVRLTTACIRSASTRPLTPWRGLSVQPRS
jgi:hypothetical protein